MSEIKTHQVVHRGSNDYGQEELDRLLQSGWTVIDEKETESYKDGDGYEVWKTIYKLQRDW